MDYGLAVEALYSRDRPLSVEEPSEAENAARRNTFD
jgi:hypothetical protein